MKHQSIGNSVCPLCQYKTYKYLPQPGPSYMAVMSNMTDAADGFPITPHAHFPFSPLQLNPCTRCIRGFLRHVNCDYQLIIDGSQESVFVALGINLASSICESALTDKQRAALVYSGENIMKEKPLLKLRSFGQSLLLDYIRRCMLVSGDLVRLVKPLVAWLMVPSATTGGA